MAVLGSGPRRLRVLVVDDDADLRALVTAVLEESGKFEVVGEAADGATALELTAARRPDAVVLDLLLPGMSGLEVLPAMCRRAPGVRIVVFTGHREIASHLAALERGAASYVVKGDILPLITALESASPNELARTTVQLPHDPTACRDARRFVDATCSRWQCPDVAEAALLVTTELVGNVVIHARTNAWLTLRLWPDAFRVEVSDTSPDAVAPRDADDASESGRGLLIVGAVAIAWGVVPTSPGKTVWADIARSSSAVAA